MSKKTNKFDARVQAPERHQQEWRPLSLDELIAEDHLARLIWDYVQKVDLTRVYQEIRATSTRPGRSPIAPEILLSLWLYATLESIGSAREIARRCERDLAFMWICGGVPVNYHTISDFRKDHVDVLEDFLRTSVVSLVDNNLVSLDRIAQDGMRVRASAGRSSFRRKPTLEQLNQQCQEHLNALKDDASQEVSKRKQAAKKRAAEDRAKRLEQAIEEQKELAEAREKRRKGSGEETRCSTTDPEARTMKMANGGYDAAFNVQLATDTGSRIITGVEVTNAGTDANELCPMLEKLKENYGKQPNEVLVDSAYATQAAVTELEQAGIKVIAGIPRKQQLINNNKDPYSRQKRDTEEYVTFRVRMSKKEAKEAYKKRSSVAEFVNAVFRNNGLQQFLVRGLKKVKAVALLHAIAHNFRQMLAWGMFGSTSYSR